MTRPSKRLPRWLDDPEASLGFSSAMNLEAQCVSWFLSPWSHLGCLHCPLPAPGLHPVPATLPQGLSSLGRASETCFRNVGPAPLTGLCVLAPPTSLGAWACGEWPLDLWPPRFRFLSLGLSPPRLRCPPRDPLVLLGREQGGHRKGDRKPVFPAFPQGFSQRIRALGLVLYVADISNRWSTGGPSYSQPVSDCSVYVCFVFP